MKEIDTTYSGKMVCLDEEDIKRLDEAPFFEILIGHRNSFQRIYRLRLDTQNYYFKVRNTETIKKGYYCPFEWAGPSLQQFRYDDSKKNKFEIVFENMPEEIKAEMVFYFDIFLKT